MTMSLTKTPTDAELAKRYSETYGRASYTQEQVDRMSAAAPVVRRERRSPSR